MKLTAVIAIVLSIVRFAGAQDSHPWNLTAEGGLNYSYRILKNGDGSEQTNIIKSVWDSVEKPVGGYSMSLSGKHLLNHWCRIQAGLGFNEVGSRITIDSLFYGFGIPPPTPYPVAVTTKNYWQFLEMASGICFGKLTGKLNMAATAGVGISWFMNSRYYSNIIYDDGSEKTDVSSAGSSEPQNNIVNPINAFIFIQPSAEYHLGNSFSLGAGPLFKYYFVPMHKFPEDTIKAFFYSISFNAMIGYSF